MDLIYSELEVDLGQHSSSALAPPQVPTGGRWSLKVDIALGRGDASRAQVGRPLRVLDVELRGRLVASWRGLAVLVGRDNMRNDHGVQLHGAWLLVDEEPLLHLVVVCRVVGVEDLDALLMWMPFDNSLLRFLGLCCHDLPFLVSTLLLI